MIFISVIIATYNRSADLAKVLESLLSQKTDGSFDHEIIIVDNNSKDNTKEIVKSFISRNSKIQYILESKQGKSNAMNVGINNSKGEIFAFTDDDVILDENYLLNIAHFALECDFDALGGRVLPLYPENTPQWIKDCKDILNGPIVYYDCGETVQKYNTTMLPFIGANMIMKRQVFEEVGGFNPDLGPGKGTMGDDTEYFRRLQKAEKKIFYDPNVLIFHPVSKNRMNLKYFAEWNMFAGNYLVLRISEKEDKNPVLIFGVPLYLFPQIFNFLWQMLTSFNNKRRFIQAWGDFFTRVGMISAYRFKSQGKL